MSKITKTIASTIIAGGAVLSLGDRAALTQSGYYQSDYYYLQARHSGQCLNVFNSGQNNGDNVVQGEKCDTPNFQWKIVPANNGYYYLQARHSLQCLNVLNSGQNNGDNVVQGEECDTPNFQWKIVSAGNNVNYLQARHSGQCLNVWNGGQNNGDNVVQGEECRSSNFQWEIVPVADVRPSKSDYYRQRNRDRDRRDDDLRRREPARRF